MWQPDAFQEEVLKRADGSYDLFLQRFLESRIGRPCEDRGDARRYLRAYKVSTLPKLRALADKAGDLRLVAMTMEYAATLKWIGFDENGAGGPRNLPYMDANEIDSFCRQMKRIHWNLEIQRRAAARIVRMNSKMYGLRGINSGIWETT